MIRVLRLARAGGLITAEVFEELFVRELGAALSVDAAPLEGWCDGVLGSPAGAPDPEGAARRFAEAARGVDFVCPSYEGFALAPLLAAARNRAGSPCRFLLIAHAPGAYALEWALLAPLLAPGDVVVTPSESARATVELLCPALAPRLRVIPHPMRPLPAPAAPGERRMVSLGRLHASKLVHRQVEAMALLRDRGVPVPRMEIAGPLGDAGVSGPHPYARSLAEKVRRLRLEGRVRLTGAVRGEAAKASFLSGAALLVNLSVTVEESFGKAPVEALGAGVPVLATRWDGLVETVGPCGVLLDVDVVPPGVPDVSAAAVADGIERLLAEPPSPEACRAHAAEFAPERVRARYAAVLREALAESGPTPDFPDASLPAAPPAGLLAATAPLTAMPWRQAYALAAESCAAMRRGWAGQPSPALPDGERLRDLVLRGTRPALEAALRGAAVESPVRADHHRATERVSVDRTPVRGAALESASADGEASAETGSLENAGMERASAGSASDGSGAVDRPRFGPAGGFHDQLAAGAMGTALLPSRLACLLEIRGAGGTETLRAGLARLRDEGIATPGTLFLGVELAVADGDAAGAFDACLAGIRAAADEGEHGGFRRRQLASVARRWGRPEAAAGPLAEWLERHPDSPESGPAWLDLAAIAGEAGPAHLARACHAVERARALLGPHPTVERVEAVIHAAAGRAAVA